MKSSFSLIVDCDSLISRSAAATLVALSSLNGVICSLLYLFECAALIVSKTGLKTRESLVETRMVSVTLLMARNSSE